jgi:hypothetical protein
MSLLDWDPRDREPRDLLHIANALQTFLNAGHTLDQASEAVRRVFGNSQDVIRAINAAGESLRLNIGNAAQAVIGSEGQIATRSRLAADALRGRVSEGDLVRARQEQPESDPGSGTPFPTSTPMATGMSLYNLL